MIHMVMIWGDKVLMILRDYKNSRSASSCRNICGDEFILVLERFSTEEELMQHIETIRIRLRENIVVDRIVFPLSCSFGVSYYRIYF